VGRGEGVSGYMFNYIVPRGVAKSDQPDISQMRLELNRESQASSQLHDRSRVNKVGDSESVWKDSRKSHSVSRVTWKLVEEERLSGACHQAQVCCKLASCQRSGEDRKGRGGEALECTCCWQQYRWVKLQGVCHRSEIPVATYRNKAKFAGDGEMQLDGSKL
jgi:hypothetical protein